MNDAGRCVLGAATVAQGGWSTACRRWCMFLVFFRQSGAKFMFVNMPHAQQAGNYSFFCLFAQHTSAGCWMCLEQDALSPTACGTVANMTKTLVLTSFSFFAQHTAEGFWAVASIHACLEHALRPFMKRTSAHLVHKPCIFPDNLLHLFRVSP